MLLYSASVDLTKAFDTVNGEAIWTVHERIGCPLNFVTMIRIFYVGMIGQVLSSCNVTGNFEISNGVK